MEPDRARWESRQRPIDTGSLRDRPVRYRRLCNRRRLGVYQQHEGYVILDAMNVEERAARAVQEFDRAWRRLEEHLESTYADAGTDEHGEGRQRALIEEARRRGHLREDSRRFLHACRRLRNVYTHVNYEGYAGPLTVPPTPVLNRFIALVDDLTRPPKIGSYAAEAVTCEATSLLVDVLVTMKDHDFSQLPYRVGTRWRLVTREQVACFVEAQVALEGVALVSLEGVRAIDVAEAAPSEPEGANEGEPVRNVVATLAHLLENPSTEKYPAVIVFPRRMGSLPRIVLADDLPRLYAALGR